MTSKEVAIQAARLLDGKKAQDIVILDIGPRSSFADYMVISSGGSERQVGTLTEEIDDHFAKEGVILKNIEGKKSSGWILMDYGDVIINVFSQEQRQRYNIEKIWSDCDSVEFMEE